MNSYNPYEQALNKPAAQQQQQNNLISVINVNGGEDSALRYLLAPNSTAFFMSGDTSEMFMRGTDANGMTSLFRAFDIVEKMPKYQMNMLDNSLGDYATKDDLAKVSDEIKDLRHFIEDLTSPTTKEG